MKLSQFRAQTIRFNVRLLCAAQEVGADAEALFEKLKTKKADRILLRMRIAEGLKWLRSEGYL